jgi:hypothetical protein
LTTTAAPVLKHREWRFLLREFVNAYPVMRPLAGQLLQHCLTPAASVAWWLARTQPELLERDVLHVLLLGAGPVECMDDGRWFSFMPWLMGRPQMKTRVVLVGDELNAMPDGGEAARAFGMQGRTSPAKNQVASREKSALFNQTLAQWRAGEGRGAPVDACVLFHPGFVFHYRTWFTEDDLLPLLRQGVPTGTFCYSKMDGLEDEEALRLLGIETVSEEPALNPWHIPHEFGELVGSFAQFAQTLRITSIPASLNLDNPGFEEFRDLEDYARADYEEFGADPALERLGARWGVVNPKTGVEDAIIVLPRSQGILASTGALGDFDDEGFRAYEPPLLVPAEHLAARPSDDRPLARILWALKLHRDWVAPATEEWEDENGEEEDEALLFGGMDLDDLNEGMREFLKSATGQDIDPEDFMRQMRIQGGVHGPTHPCWWDLFETLGWDPQDYVDEPARLQPAFRVKADSYSTDLPVICEAYAYFPDDLKDDLAVSAMKKVEKAHPHGAFLLFKSMPYQEVAGHKYSFGGMLFWRQHWHPFALNAQMTSASHVLDQVESGFSFETANPAYADDHCALAAPFNRMCQGCDPNQNMPMYGLKQRKWVTLMPGGEGPD